MTGDILAIAGAGTTALALAAILVLTYKLVGAFDDLKGSLAGEALATRAQQVAEDARDGALAQSARDAAALKDALAQLAATQAATNAEGKELEAHVEHEIASSSPADAAHLVDELLGAPISAAGAAAAAAGDDRSHASAAAVPPPAAAGGGDPRRGS